MRGTINVVVPPGDDREREAILAFGTGDAYILQGIHEETRGEPPGFRMRRLRSLRKRASGLHAAKKRVSLGPQQFTRSCLHANSLLAPSKQSKAHRSKLESDQHQRNATQLTRIATQQQMIYSHEPFIYSQLTFLKYRSIRDCESPKNLLCGSLDCTSSCSEVTETTQSETGRSSPCIPGLTPSRTMASHVPTARRAWRSLLSPSHTT